MTIQRGNAGASKGFSANLNIILTGSKKMSVEEQTAAMPVESVRILITDADDPGNVLLDTLAHGKEFKTMSVGYDVQQAGLQFKKGADAPR